MVPTILVMDDESIIRLLLGKTLGKKYTIVLKENGLKGIEWIQQGNIPDLVVTDQFMPEKNGYDFMSFIRSNDYLTHIPVIMLSGMESSEEKNKSLSMGFSAYLTKPLNIELLMERIDSLLSIQN